MKLIYYTRKFKFLPKILTQICLMIFSQNPMYFTTLVHLSPTFASSHHNLFKMSTSYHWHLKIYFGLGYIWHFKSKFFWDKRGAIFPTWTIMIEFYKLIFILSNCIYFAKQIQKYFKIICKEKIEKLKKLTLVWKIEHCFIIWDVYTIPDPTKVWTSQF